MSHASRFLALATATLLVGAAACSTDGPTALTPRAASRSKSGTAPSGGSSNVDTSTTSTSTSTSSSPSGPPVAPSFTARIDSIGVLPTAMYYGMPSQWTIGGYIFEANSLTHLKAANGPLVVGACASVTFSVTYTGAYIASEIKTESASKCGG